MGIAEQPFVSITLSLAPSLFGREGSEQSHWTAHCSRFMSESWARAMQHVLSSGASEIADIWDEVFVEITRTQEYVWRAADQDGGVTDNLVQPRCGQRVAERFFYRLLQELSSGSPNCFCRMSSAKSAATPTARDSAREESGRYDNSNL